MAECPSIGDLIRELRLSRGWSQSRLAAHLRDASGYPTITREDISRYERGKRTPGPFWLGHLAAVLDVPVARLEAHMRRRVFISGLAGSTLLPLLESPTDAVATEMAASIASSDTSIFGAVQTTHETDLLVSAAIQSDRASRLHLARWMEDGDNDVLRVNAAGVLAKTQTDVELLDAVPCALRRDPDTRRRYVAAVVGRVGSNPRRLVRELLNDRDAGARWCSAVLLAEQPVARPALIEALRTEPVRETVRTIGLILSGVDPCT